MPVQTFPTQEMQLGAASVRCEGTRLQVNTGLMQRVWELTNHGLLTRRVTDLASGKVWERPTSSLTADWVLPLANEEKVNGWLSSAELTETVMTAGDDEGFTSEHLSATVALTYRQDLLQVQWHVWVYPGAPGVRTQLMARALPGFECTAERSTARDFVGFLRCDAVPVSFEGTTRRMIGLYGETQQRNDTDLDLLQEVERTGNLRAPEYCTWANALCVEQGARGIALVKESHKFINQNGHDTGVFICDPGAGLASHGWGLLPGELTEAFQPGWASWCLVYDGDDAARQRAFKRFDRIRYPLDRQRDIYVQANTWGSSYGHIEHRDAAGEENVLKELGSCADLGIDVLQIDDGWQGNDYSQWVPWEERYPEGWTNVREHAESLGVQLGLWAAAEPVGLDDLKRAWEEGGFVSYKLDFASLTSRAKLQALMDKARAFIAGTGHTVRINWDLTEVCARYGYFFAREYGHIFLENRKPVVPKCTTYKPHTVLRDLWQLSKYVNLLKFQGSVQNVDRVNRGLSDAWMHSHDYCLAITLMSTPLFFQQTFYYDEPARQQLRPLLKVYKEHREAIYRGIVYPIGDKPDNASWTGFQSHDAETGVSFLSVFRELNNDQPKATLRLHWMNGQPLKLTNLMTGESWETESGANGEVTFTIDGVPGYLFLRCVPR